MPVSSDCVASLFKPFYNFRPRCIFYRISVPGKYFSTFLEKNLNMIPSPCPNKSPFINFWQVFLCHLSPRKGEAFCELPLQPLYLVGCVVLHTAFQTAAVNACWANPAWLQTEIQGWARHSMILWFLPQPASAAAAVALCLHFELLLLADWMLARVRGSCAENPFQQ